MDKPTAVVVGVGAEQGVGGAVCRRFASEGYHVYVAGRTEAKIAKVVDTIAKAGARSAVGRRRSSAYDASVGHLNYVQPDAFNSKPRCTRCSRVVRPKAIIFLRRKTH